VNAVEFQDDSAPAGGSSRKSIRCRVRVPPTRRVYGSYADLGVIPIAWRSPLLKQRSA
jgi:hypothetical protein